MKKYVAAAALAIGVLGTGIANQNEEVLPVITSDWVVESGKYVNGNWARSQAKSFSYWNNVYNTELNRINLAIEQFYSDALNDQIPVAPKWEVALPSTLLPNSISEFIASPTFMSNQSERGATWSYAPVDFKNATLCVQYTIGSLEEMQGLMRAHNRTDTARVAADCVSSAYEVAPIVYPAQAALKYEVRAYEPPAPSPELLQELANLEVMAEQIALQLNNPEGLRPSQIVGFSAMTPQEKLTYLKNAQQFREHERMERAREDSKEVGKGKTESKAR